MHRCKRIRKNKFEETKVNFIENSHRFKDQVYVWKDKKIGLASKGKELCDASDIDEKINCMGVKNSYELCEEDKRLQLIHIKV